MHTTHHSNNRWQPGQSGRSSWFSDHAHEGDDTFEQFGNGCGFCMAQMHAVIHNSKNDDVGQRLQKHLLSKIVGAAGNWLSPGRSFCVSQIFSVLCILKFTSLFKKVVTNQNFENRSGRTQLVTSRAIILRAQNSPLSYVFFNSLTFRKRY